MRWFIAALAALVIAWASYVASPYLALRKLGVAVAAGDETALSRQVNFRALRHTLARHVVTELSAADRAGALSASDAQLAAGALAVAANPLLESLLTAKGVADLLRGELRPADGIARAAPFAAGPPQIGRLAQLLQASQWRGFRNVYFSLPLDASREERFRLQLRLSRFTWRLVGIELPTGLRRTIAQEILQRQRGLRR